MWRLFRAWRSLCLDLLSLEHFLLELGKSASQKICLLLVRVIAKPEVAIRMRVYKALEILDLGVQGFAKPGLPVIHVIAPRRTPAD
jgi:hypothetical protein